jgi:hypothetical protein
MKVNNTKMTMQTEINKNDRAVVGGMDRVMTLFGIDVGNKFRYRKYTKNHENKSNGRCLWPAVRIVSSGRTIRNCCGYSSREQVIQF